jgi:hypothetical protein
LKSKVLVSLIIIINGKIANGAAQENPSKRRSRPELLNIIFVKEDSDSPTPSPLDQPNRATENPILMTSALEQTLKKFPTTSEIEITMSPQKRLSKNPYANSPIRRSIKLAMSPALVKQTKSTCVKSPELIAIYNQAATTWITLKSCRATHCTPTNARISEITSPTERLNLYKRNQLIWNRAIQPIRQEKLDQAMRNWNEYTQNLID